MKSNKNDSLNLLSSCILKIIFILKAGLKNINGPIYYKRIKINKKNYINFIITHTFDENSQHKLIFKLHYGVSVFKIIMITLF